MEYWDQLQQDLINRERPWILIGDLNEILRVTEKWRGRTIWKRKLFLKDFLNETLTIYVVFKGHMYTWSNGQNGNGLIKERLDRVVASREWIEVYPNTSMEHLVADESL